LHPCRGGEGKELGPALVASIAWCRKREKKTKERRKNMLSSVFGEGIRREWLEREKRRPLGAKRQPIKKKMKATSVREREIFLSNRSTLGLA